MPILADSNSWMMIATFVLVVLIFLRIGNEARLKRLEKKVDAIARHLHIESDAGADAEVLELARAGRKIEAIKLYRDKTGVGLKEAKDYVESL